MIEVVVLKFFLLSLLALFLNSLGPALADQGALQIACTQGVICDSVEEISQPVDDLELFKGKGPRPTAGKAAKGGSGKKALPPGKFKAKAAPKETKPLSQGKSTKKAPAGKNAKKVARGKNDKMAKKEAIFYPKPKNFSTKIDKGLQGKHVKGHSNYKQGAGKSVMASGVKPQQLLAGVHSGKHNVVGYTKSRGHPVVKFDRHIGKSADGKKSTRYGSLHSGKNGVHIVPHFGAMNRP